MRALVCAAFAVLAACSPYDPSLPHKPFLCNEQEPRCPDGFTCVPEGDLRVCSDQPAPDAGLGDALPAQVSAP